MSWHRNYAKFCEKKSQNRRNQGFSYYFCLMLEGSIPLTNGTRIRIRIQEAQKHVDPGDMDPGDLDPDSDPDAQNCSYSRGYKNRAIRGGFCVTSPD